MRLEEIRWNDELAFLAHGEAPVEHVRQALVALGHDPECFEIGPVERFRRWPGQWNEHIEKNKSDSIVGTFKARLVQ